MSLGPLVPRNNDPRNNGDDAHNGSRGLMPAEPPEFLRPIGSALYNVLPAQESTLREYMRVLIKRKWMVMAVIVGIFMVVAVASLRQTPIYEAVGRIVVNKADSNLITFKDSGPVVDYYDQSDLDTEVRILQSDLMALQVIRQLNLDKRPEFGGRSDQKQANLVADPLQTDSTRTSALLGAFRGNLKVTLIPNTRIMEIHYSSTDPQLAASAVNTLASTYVEQNFKTKFESTMQASDWLSKQLVDLQMKVETSQEKLVRYQKEHEILGTDEKQNIITEKLDELNKEMTMAEFDRMQKEAVYRQTQSDDPDQVAAAIIAQTTTGGGATTGLLDKLRDQQAALRIQSAELSTQLGPSYPKVAQINSQLKEIDRQLETETNKAVDHLKGQYLAALQRENMLRDSFEKQKQEANKLNESAIEYSILKRDLDSNRTLYEGLLEKMKEAGVTAGLRSNNFRIIDAARVPTAPSEPNIPRNLSFALVLGIISGVGLAFVLENMDNTVRTPEQATALSALPSLGMIPLGSKSGNHGPTGKRLALTASKEVVETVTQVRPQSQMAESYRALRTSLLLSNLGAPPKVIMVTSARPQEGKTTTSINTAIVLAQKGVRVLLIDADLRRPSVHKTLGMGPRSGLSNVLTGSATTQQTITTSTILPNLFIMPAGTPPPNPAELLASLNMRTLIAELRGQYDHIVIDTPPTLSVTDAVVLSPSADATILVIRSGQTTKQALRRARDVLMQVNAHVAGVLLNAVDLTSPDYYYYYEYQGKYGQYYQEEATAADNDAESKAV
ncbi:MAG TPA: polysaccharide biosynthesis tyrosine autokinase [Terriglobales bacterium]|jgi:succinoglycan biosynthesis transport protein ExoP|nr:polysaccharide biosynthesis tyrosine autokinase [Terriglobales bacterium]